MQDVSLLNFVVSDGATMVATRFVRPESEAAATLYYAEGASFDRQPPQQQQQGEGSHGSSSSGGASSQQGCNGTLQDEGTCPAGIKGCPAAAVAAGKDSKTSVCGTQELVGSSVLCEASYSISYSERGASVAFVASEPITGSTTDWVSGVWR